MFTQPLPQYNKLRPIFLNYLHDDDPKELQIEGGGVALEDGHAARGGGAVAVLGAHGGAGVPDAGERTREGRRRESSDCDETQISSLANKEMTIKCIHGDIHFGVHCIPNV